MCDLSAEKIVQIIETKYFTDISLDSNNNNVIIMYVCM